MKLLFDEMLRNTASWMRIFGVDSKYIHPKNDNELLDIASNENRVLVTRDRQLAIRCKKYGVQCVFVNKVDIKDQLQLIVKTLKIKLNFPSRTRCPDCNTLLKIVDKKSVEDLVPKNVFRAHRKFWLCSRCNKAYWEGSHWRSILKMYRHLKQLRV